MNGLSLCLCDIVFLMFKKESIVIFSISGLFLISILSAIFLSKGTSFTSEPEFVPGSKGIAVVDLYGPIAFSSSSQSIMPSGATDVIRQLDEFESDPRVKALIIRINSPGGTVGASQEIYNAILRFKKVKKVPVIASIGDVGASGAYYAALASDTIFANPGSLVGSIGVILGNINLADFASNHGVSFQVYKSGAFKDSLSLWRKPTERESILLQTLVDDVYDQFLQTVISHRHLSTSEAATLAQGQVFSGRQALNYKLIDKLGGFSEAVSYAQKKAGLSSKPVLLSKQKAGIGDFIGLWKEEMGSSFHPSFSSPSSFELR